MWKENMVKTQKFFIWIHAASLFSWKQMVFDTAGDVETVFDTSSFELHRPLPKRKNNSVIALMKD